MHPLIFSSSSSSSPSPGPFPTGATPGLLLLPPERDAHGGPWWGVASTSKGGGTDFPYQHLSRPSVLDTSTLSAPEQGRYSEPRTPLHKSTCPSLPGALWAGRSKETIVTLWLEQVGFVLRVSSVIVGLF